MSNVQKFIWLSTIIAVCIGAGVAYNSYTKQPTITTQQQCLNGSIDACVTIDRYNKDLYKTLEITQQQIAENNKWIKEHTQKLLSGSSFQ